MTDWVGLIFFVLLIVGIFVGLKILSRPVKRTEAEFERNAAESTSMLGAGMSALQEAIDPAAARAKEVQMQLKEGRYGKKKREGKAGRDAESGQTGDVDE
jgi:hypothetical protein